MLSSIGKIELFNNFFNSFFLVPKHSISSISEVMCYRIALIACKGTPKNAIFDGIINEDNPMAIFIVRFECLIFHLSLYRTTSRSRDKHNFC